MDEETIKKQVGNKIKQLRQIKSWSRPQVASKLEMSENNYGCIERGEINISLTHLAQLAEIFDTSIPDLIGADGKNIFNLNGKGKNFQNWIVGNSDIETLNLKHELEKAFLTQQSLEKENELLRKQVLQLEQINQLLKNTNS
jgi:transcriptional regulator with XRE-family HTH domain